VSTLISPPPVVWADMVRLAVQEDLGRRGDITSRSIFSNKDQGRAAFMARKGGVVCGLDVAREVCRICDAALIFTPEKQDGDVVKAGDVLARIEGPAIGILEAERTALNYLSHLSGVASMTHRFIEIVAGTKAKICCTRKTTPNLRTLEKYAVVCGGGSNHRFGLDDAVLIKDNHIAMAGSVGAAITRAREAVGHMIKIEVEVDTLVQLEEVLTHKVDAVLLDNWPLTDFVQAINVIDGRAVVETSGGISLDTVRAVAESGVDLISVGALTHSALILDIGLDIF